MRREDAHDRWDSRNPENVDWIALPDGRPTIPRGPVS
jgi:hypothetical protein